jgi:hypothetical protein
MRKNMKYVTIAHVLALNLGCWRAPTTTNNNSSLERRSFSNGIHHLGGVTDFRACQRRNRSIRRRRLGKRRLALHGIVPLHLGVHELAGLKVCTARKRIDDARHWVASAQFDFQRNERQ